MSDNQTCDIHETIRSSSSSLIRAPSWSLGVGASPDDDNLPAWQQAGTSALLANGSSNSANANDDSQHTNEVENPVLHLHIPTVYLTRKDPSSSSYHVYQLVCRIEDHEWSIYRRYSQFYALNQQLKALDAAIGKFQFPPKRRINSKASTIVQNRRLKLEEYMRCLSNYISRLPVNHQPGEGSSYQQLCDMLTVPGVSSTSATTTSSRISSACGRSSISEASASSEQADGYLQAREDLSNSPGQSASRLSRRSDNQGISCSPNEKATLRSLFHNFISLKEKKSEDLDSINLGG